LFFPQKEGDTALTTWLQKKPADILYRVDHDKELLATFENGETVKAIIYFLASFYLLDLDYPSRLGSLT
jgi:DNA recombination-dependent growth factor C